MARHITLSVDDELFDFIHKNKLSPSSLMKDKINEILLTEEKKGENVPLFMKRLPNALALLSVSQLRRLDKFNKNAQKTGMTKWQRAYWKCNTHEQREELLRQFQIAMGMNEDGTWEENTKQESKNSVTDAE